MKRLLSAILALTMALCLMPNAALATAAASVFVGGVELTAGQYLANGGTEATATAPASGGYAYFDTTSGVPTLTLSNAIITAARTMKDGKGKSIQAGIYVSGALTIKLSGTNTITGAAVTIGTNSYGIYWRDGDLTIDKTTSDAADVLTVTGGAVSSGEGEYGSDSYGIFCDDTDNKENITINGGTVTLAGGGIDVESNSSVSFESRGIYFNNGGDFNINGGTVNLKGGAIAINNTSKGDVDAFSSGAFCPGFNINGGTVTANGGVINVTAADGNASISSYGVFGSPNITGGSLTAKGNTVTANATGNVLMSCDGIYAQSGVNVSAGSIIATGSTTNATSGTVTLDKSSGIDTGSVIITGGSVTATGGTTSSTVGKSCGIYNSGGWAGCTVSGGTLNATGGNVSATGNSSGIYAGWYNGFTIKGDDTTVNATGGTGGASCGIYSLGRMELTIKGGTLNATGNTSAINEFSAEATKMTVTGHNDYKQTTLTGATWDATSKNYRIDPATAAAKTLKLVPREYKYNTPDPIEQNGVTATVTYSPASPQYATKSVTATVTLTGTATKTGILSVDLTSTKAELASSPQMVDVSAGQNLTAVPVTKTFTFTVPEKDVDDLTLTYFLVPDYTMDFTATDTQTWAGSKAPATEDCSGTGWDWKYESKTLTLSGLDFITTKETALKLPDGAKIVLDENTESSVKSIYTGEKLSYAIHSAGELEISGEGTLNATCGDSMMSYGIYARNSVTISSGIVNATGGNAKRTSTGIAVDYNAVTIQGTAEVTATGGTVAGYAIDTPSNTSNGITSAYVVVKDSAYLRAVGGTNNGSVDIVLSRGILGFSGVTISGGMVEATGGEAANGDSIGISGPTTISGGYYIEAVGGKAANGDSFGISGQTTISGGYIEAYGGEAKNQSFGIAGQTTITDGYVFAGSDEATTQRAFENPPELNDYVGGYQWSANDIDENNTLMHGSTTPYYDNNSHTYVEIMPEGARVGNVTVTGTKDTAITPATVTLILSDDYFEGDNLTEKMDVSEWFTNLPAGLSAEFTGINDDSNVITVTISGTPTALSTAAIEVTIPMAYINHGENAIEFSANPKAKYAITDAVVPTPSPATGGSRGGDDAPETTNTTIYNSNSIPAATIWLTGNNLPGGELLITEALTSGGDYDALLKLADTDDIFRVYNIFLKSGKKSTGSAMFLTFDLADGYAAQDLTLVQKKADDTIEYLYATADARGDLKFGPLYELSSFMLVKGTLTQYSGAQASIPQTGDSAAPELWICVAALSAIGLAGCVVMRRRKKHNS